MNLSDQYDSSVPVRSLFVSTLAVISIFVSLYQIYTTIQSMTFADSLSGLKGLGLSDEMMESLMPSPAAGYFEIVLAMLLIAASVMMFKRMGQGRVMYMGVLTAGSLWTTVTTVQSYLSLSQYLQLPSVKENSLLLMFVSVAMTIGINIYLVRKLMREEVRSEFRQ